jgi:hypothetical protein
MYKLHNVHIEYLHLFWFQEGPALKIVGVFCDLTKAFDCINHELLKKLEFYGIKSVLLYWLSSYLDERKQTVDLKLPKFNNSSEWHTVEHGVVPGSVLGTLLFCCYVNGFPVLINKNTGVIMFAYDNTYISYS